VNKHLYPFILTTIFQVDLGYPVPECLLFTGRSCHPTTGVKHSKNIRRTNILNIQTVCTISLRFNGHFPGGPGLAGTRMSPFWISLELRMMEVVVTTGAVRRAKLQSNHHYQQTNTSHLSTGLIPSCRRTNSFTALKG